MAVGHGGRSLTVAPPVSGQTRNGNAVASIITLTYWGVDKQRTRLRAGGSAIMRTLPLPGGRRA